MPSLRREFIVETPSTRMVTQQGPQGVVDNDARLQAPKGMHLHILDAGKERPKIIRACGPFEQQNLYGTYNVLHYIYTLSRRTCREPYRMNRQSIDIEEHRHAVLRAASSDGFIVLSSVGLLLRNQTVPLP